MPEECDDKSVGGTSWRWIELLFGGGIIAYLIGATISGIWWAATIDSTSKDLSDTVADVERRIDGLDNVTLGNRLTAVETQVKLFDIQQDRIERKIDRLLDRQVRPPG